MKKNKKVILSIFWIVLGAGLIVASKLARLDAYWMGMGGGLVFVGALQLFRFIQYNRYPEYKNAVDTEINDERNRFIRAQAWAYTGYILVIIFALASIVLAIFAQELLSTIFSSCVCLIVLLYWITFHILNRKY